jgi:hypothetical protein
MPVKLICKAIFVSLIFISEAILAQNEQSKWIFGKYTGVDFMTNPPSVITHSTLFSYEGTASIADSAGNLLFYTDGVTVWNQQMQVMANGTGLMGNGSTVQSSLIVRQPGFFSRYLIFTLDAQGWSNGLRYSVVEMSLASGNGSVTSKNIPIIIPCTEQLAATRHCNGRDIWLVTHSIPGNYFYSFLITASGVNTSVVTSTVGPPPPTFTPNMVAYGQGTIKISRTGKKLGLTFFNGSNDSEVALFDFDRNTGMVSNYLSLKTLSVNCYGCEFSPDGSKFYTAVTQGTAVIQWDVCAGSNSLIAASETTIGGGQGGMGQLLLAPNGKIYCWGGPFLLAGILNPNLAGTACNFTSSAISLGTGTTYVGLPTFIAEVQTNIQSFTYSASMCQVASFSAPTFSALGCTTIAPSSINWNFGDPLSGSQNASSMANPTHTFSSAGTYTVKLWFGTGCDTMYRVVQMSGLQPQVSTTSSLLCTGQPATLQITTTGGTPPFTYTWTGGAQTSSIVTTSQQPGVQGHSVTVTDQSGCKGFAAIQVQFLATPVLSASSRTICPGAVVTLTVSGATTYSWLTSASTGSTSIVSPTATAVYTVQGNTNGCASTNTLSVTVSKCAAVTDAIEIENFKVYPQPVQDLLIIESPYAVELRIHDVHGRTIKWQALSGGDNRVDLSQLDPGVYYMTVNGQRLGRVIKGE